MDINEDFVSQLYARTEKLKSGNPKLIPTEKQSKILQDLWSKGTVRKDELAKALGVSIGTMRRWAHEAKL